MVVEGPARMAHQHKFERIGEPGPLTLIQACRSLKAELEELVNRARGKAENVERDTRTTESKGNRMAWESANDKRSRHVATEEGWW